MSNTKTSTAGSIVAFTVSVIFIVLAGTLFLNRQHVLDQLAVWSYQPTAAVEDVSQKVGFTSRGEFTFYATKPSIESPENFNKLCPRQEPGSPILGCYTSDDRIYIYDLTNEKLYGMEEVTAAHEMLHAMWSRTSASDQKKLASELRSAYEKIDNSELKDRMSYYERTEPGEFINELHSILGTEFRSLGEPLESYYEQLFSREKVLSLHDKYNTVYKNLNNRGDYLYGEMQTLALTLQSRSTEYENSAQQLTADISSFNARANNCTFESQGQFNRERSNLTSRTSELESKRQLINADIATYNSYYNEYQEISKQIKLLNDSLDSFKQIDKSPLV